MNDISKTLQERSRQQTAMTALMLKIKAEDRRFIAIETLGKKTNAKHSSKHPATSQKPPPPKFRKHSRKSSTSKAKSIPVSIHAPAGGATSLRS